MAKKNTQSSSKNKAFPSRRNSKALSRKFNQGIGYVLEPGMSRSDLKKLYSDWNDKLQKSSLPQIESFSPSGSGQFSPFFVSSLQNKQTKSPSGSSAAGGIRNYTSDKQEYYRLVSIFVQCANFKAIFGTRKCRLFKFLLTLHAEGETYEAILAEYKRKYKAHTKIRLSHGLSFIWKNIQEALEPLYDWNRTDSEGGWYVEPE